MPDVDSKNPPANQADDTQNLDELLNNVANLTKQQIKNDPVFSQSLASTPQLQEIIIKIEEDLLREIITRMENSSLSSAKAQQLAKEFLSYLPIRDQKDLLDKLQLLSRSYQEVQGIFLKYASANEEQDRLQKLELITSHIQNGNIDQAISVAKGETPNG